MTIYRVLRWVRYNETPHVVAHYKNRDRAWRRMRLEVSRARRAGERLETDGGANWNVAYHVDNVQVL